MNIKGIWSIAALFFFLTIGNSVSAQQMPTFSFKDLNGGAFTNAQLTPGKATIIFYFNPYCDHCEKQAEWVTAQPELFKDIQLLWVTFEPDKEAITIFRDTFFKEDTWKNVHFLIDKDYMFDTWFGYTEVLSSYVYNASGNLVRIFTRETPAYQLFSSAGKI